MHGPSPERELRQLIDEYRARCLWYLKEDYYPITVAERERVLDLIAQHGDLRAFQRVAALRAWLSQSSNETFAVS